MASRTKKIAAALAAVSEYLEAEAAAAAASARPERPVAAGPTAWSMAGRLDMMASRMASRGLARG